ncbi:hypothetical protein K2X14_08160 [Acetobacter sp. TBRC 12305]|uniref:hypothetical protein n=1 Tax=Acetobacter garciniae TaxID=2817435 RepID=UPI001C72CB85|nr:hypothetical protein [Acetobacter garciniae]MBX0344806.1 hypothetical protein [Acetobacter garciniae]
MLWREMVRYLVALPPRYIKLQAVTAVSHLTVKSNKNTIATTGRTKGVLGMDFFLSLDAGCGEPNLSGGLQARHGRNA